MEKKELQAQINYAAIGTWLEPYIGYKFKVVKKCKRSTSVRWWGRVEKWIPNKMIKI